MNSKLMTLAVFLVVLVVETVSLMLLVTAIGPVLATCWVAITFCAGVGVVVRAPFRGPESVRLEVMEGRMDVSAALKHLVVVRAGSLLMLPGVVTDIAGVALSVPVVQDWVVGKMIRDGQVRVQQSGRLDRDDLGPSG